MEAIQDWLLTSPEAVATLSVAAVAFLGGLLYSLVNHRVIVRLLNQRCVIEIQNEYRRKIKITYDETLATEIRQIDFEILNSNPQTALRDVQVSIVLPSPEIRILGIDTANATVLGGQIQVADESIVAEDSEYTESLAEKTLNDEKMVKGRKIAIKIPYLRRSLDANRVFIRVTYDGPVTNPWVISGEHSAKLETRESYVGAVMWTTLIYLFLVFLLLSSFGGASAMVVLGSLAGFVAGISLGGDKIRLRPLNQLTLSIPSTPAQLTEAFKKT